MPLANDLTGLIHRFGSAMAAAADSVLIPRHKPTDALPDLHLLEQCRSKQTGQPFTFFPSQSQKIAGALAGLKNTRRVWMVCEMGCGKSPMSLAAAWLLLRHKPFRILIMSPGHIVRKWRREVEWLIPGADCHVIKNFTDLQRFKTKAEVSEDLMIAVVSKETVKLGFDVDRPCAAKRKMRMHTNAENGTEQISIVDIACCPSCGETVPDNQGENSQPFIYEEYIARNQPLVCSRCGDRLLTNARGFRKNLHLDRYIQRHMKGVFDLLIADEVHELSGPETIQGNTFGTLASACRYTLALTGTLIGGKAQDLHAPLWRMSAGLLNQRGFNIRAFKGSRISAIARNERGFIRQYGVMEHQIVRRCDGDDYSGRITRGACGRRKSYKTSEVPRPGISPDLFNHFLLDRAVFMGLHELGPALPSIERIPVPCSMSSELKAAYDKLDDQLKTAIKSRVGGKGPPALACTRIMSLGAYLDKPWGWSPIDKRQSFFPTTTIIIPVCLGNGCCAEAGVFYDPFVQ